MQRLLGPIVVIALFLAGCADSSGGTASTSPSPGGSQVVSTSSDEAVGTIEGTVVDDEERPVGEAAVSLVRLGVEVKTTAGGVFKFTNVPVGKHDVVAAKLGYDSSAKKVEVFADEVAKVRFVLAILAVTESYPLTIPHVAQHHLGLTQYLTWAVNLTGDGSAMCSGCVWTIHSEKRPSFMMFEITGNHAVASPRGTKEYLWVFQTNYNGGAEVGRVVMTLPGNVTYDDAKLGKVKVWWAQILCDTEWFCLEEKRNIYVTLFYDYEELPEGFTAIPK